MIINTHLCYTSIVRYHYMGIEFMSHCPSRRGILDYIRHTIPGLLAMERMASNLRPIQLLCIKISMVPYHYITKSF